MTAQKSFMQQIITRRVKQWAFDNAYTLIFLSFMFVVTWIGLVISICK